MNFPITPSAQAHSSISTPQSKSLILNEGQMIHGQIKQLFPGQMAEVQIGNQTLIAKLEVPMKVGDAYYFQVGSVKPEYQLKIIAGPTSGTEEQSRQLNNLIEVMQLPKTAEMRQLLSSVMKNKVPITREGLLQAEALLKGVPLAARPEALASIQKIIELKLPLTESVFRSIFGVQAKEGLHTVLTSLRNAVADDSTIILQARETIIAALDKAATPFKEATGSALLGKSLLTLLDSSERPEARFATVQLLKNTGILPERASLANLPQVLTSLITNESTVPQLPGSQALGTPYALIAELPGGIMQKLVSVLGQISSTPTQATHMQLEGLKAIISTEAGLSAANKEALTAIIDRATTARPSSEVTTKLIQEFSQALIRINAEMSITSPFRAELTAEEVRNPSQQSATEKLDLLFRHAKQADNPVVQKLLQTAEGAVANAIEGKAVKDAMQTMMRSFGFNYESALLGKDSDIGRLADSLKPQLIALMHDSSVSQAVRDSAEAVVTRMNGPLLISGENGVQHQLVTQIPLEFFGRRIDATLEWNGRMKEDGKIDPDFARILFYLDLHSLKKTIIDMQVQNRIVSVTVFNADPGLSTVGNLISERLKEGLESTGYKLSGIFFKNFSEEKVNKQSIIKKSPDSQGVDFRI